jgi:hypothetical protein
LAKTSVVTAKLLQHTTITKKGKKKQTNKRNLKNTQLRRTRKPTNQTRALTQREESYLCFAAKVQRDIKDSKEQQQGKNKKKMKRRRRRKTSSKATNRVVKTTTTGWMESAKLSAENHHPWAMQMEGKLGWAFPLLFRAQNLRFLIIYMLKSTKIGVSVVGSFVVVVVVFFLLLWGLLLDSSSALLLLFFNLLLQWILDSRLLGEKSSDVNLLTLQCHNWYILTIHP